jgi:hypothetical protein
MPANRRPGEKSDHGSWALNRLLTIEGKRPDRGEWDRSLDSSPTPSARQRWNARSRAKQVRKERTGRNRTLRRKFGSRGSCYTR